MSNEVKIIMADDHPVFRQGLRMIIESNPSFKVLREAGDGPAALQAARELKPHLAVLDLDMPRLDGIGVARELRAEKWAGEIIFITMHKEEDLFREAAALDVKGYVLKDSAANDILAAIRAVADGKRYFSPALSDFLFNLGVSRRELREEKSGLEKLTPSERRILKLITENRTSKEIAAELGLSVRTVEHHRANVCTKLELRGAHSLVKFAFDNRTKL